MIPESTKRTLPASPVTLSFNKEDFMKDDFNVDHFVVECRRRVPLETLRNDLSVYLKILQSAMIELINKDYADFVNLSTNLVGVDKAINNLTTPLGQLRDEVMKVRDAMDDAIVVVEEKMNHQAAVNEKKACLQRLMAITQSVDKMEKLLGIQTTETERVTQHSQYPGEGLTGQLIERVATEFNKLQFCVNKTRGAPLVEHIKPRIGNITSTLQVSLETSFSDGLETSNIHQLRQCLRTYATIDKMRDAENLFRQQLVRPYMESVITEQYISQNPQGLQGMYQKVLEFIPKHCNKLKDALTKGNEVVRGYDFLVNAVWPEIVVNIEARTPSIFAPGNPSVFHEKYTTSLKFLESFERFCGSQASVKRLRAHPSYNTYMSKWSLPVYFQIRFQGIAGTFESVLTDPFTAAREAQGFQLVVTEVLWTCIHQCWEPDVYLDALGHRFWKLTLQLLSRYRTWIQDVFNTQLKSPSTGAEGDSATKTGTIVSASTETERTGTPPPAAPPVVPLVTTRQVVLLIADARTLAKKVPQFYASVLHPHLVKLGLQDDNAIKESLDDACQLIVATVPQFGEYIQEEITQQCAVNLKLVSDTPRLYRRTNREVPTKASGYVPNLLKPLASFLDENKDALPDDLRLSICKTILSNLTDQYYQTTSDVLTSVRKMEESLKRLKRKGGKTGGTNGPSDDDKIRLQLLLDVKNYGQQIDETGMGSGEVDSYKKLLDLVESAASSNAA